MSELSTEQDKTTEPESDADATGGALPADALTGPPDGSEATTPEVAPAGSVTEADSHEMPEPPSAPTVDDVLESESAELVDLGAEATADDADDEDDDKAVSDEAESGDADDDDAPVTGEALLVQEGEIAGDYLEQLLDILDYDGDIDLDVEGSRAVVAIVGANDLDPLVGPRGVTLDALQELTRLTVAQQTGVRTRLMLDVGGYRAGRRTELSQLAATSVARVLENGDGLRMSPMNAFERKIVHDVVTATDGVRSESEGEDPDRRVVILPDR